jgi:hypothetical protein
MVSELCLDARSSGRKEIKKELPTSQYPIPKSENYRGKEKETHRFLTLGFTGKDAPLQGHAVPLDLVCIGKPRH